ncbi:fumarylacetoacetate hydrolase domain-containing protein 2A-like isoform X1 [Amphibalanus amphitrite]|uniref:fumarylacetoacetate hydrolase domain-containing protein 2A-like isoform X1 n=1 Tax=Amphibalanus amphitrite TaxID=1232801 RepID=UPI001C90376B|nr:fumarylacetoacetate hydrolase domain-containing protein 2A-like isoform X1 [Amphibalanus amphitrite]
MKLVQCSHGGKDHIGLLSADESTVKLLTDPNLPNSAVKLLQLGSRQHVLELLKAAEATANAVPLSEVKLLAPITSPDKVLCIGMNYVDHCAEQNMPVPTEPVVFNKFPSCIVGPSDAIELPSAVTSQLDWEVELAVVIGQKCRDVSPEQADDYIFGYTVAHDVSARDWQLRRNGGQWLVGKAMDTFCPLGPCITTADSLDPANLSLWCRVNGETQQQGSTAQLVFDCRQVVSHLSRSGITLLPGDVILTGTPPGVGVFRKPPVFLKHGDVVECGVEGIGTITNKVVAV